MEFQSFHWFTNAVSTFDQQAVLCNAEPRGWALKCEVAPLKGDIQPKSGIMSLLPPSENKSSSSSGSHALESLKLDIILSLTTILHIVDFLCKPHISTFDDFFFIGCKYYHLQLQRWKQVKHLEYFILVIVFMSVRSKNGVCCLYLWINSTQAWNIEME